MAVSVEAKAWKTAYGRSLNIRYRSTMDRIVEFVSDYDKKLARPITVSKEWRQNTERNNACTCTLLIVLCILQYTCTWYKACVFTTCF